MPTFRLNTLAGILLMGLLPLSAMALDEPQSLRLLTHSSLENVSVRLDERDWRWLRGAFKVFML